MKSESDSSIRTDKLLLIKNLIEKMYSIYKKNSNGIDSLTLKNEINGELLEIIPSLGANINKLILEKEGKLFSILKTKNKKSDFIGSSIFTGAKLFPFPNRIDRGKYTFENIQYQLDRNYPEEDNACHGFVYNKEFEILNQRIENDYAEITLGHNYQGDNSGYPFRFKIELTYRLQNKLGLICTTKVINTGQKAVPLGDGWHPLIQINNCVNDLFLKFQSEKVLEINNKFIPTGKTKSYDNFTTSKKIKNTLFDNCFTLQKNGNKHSTEIYDKLNNLNVILWQETGYNKYNYLQLYIPPERDSIAIEPMTCAPNCFNDKEDLIVLQSGGVFTAQFGINIK